MLIATPIIGIAFGPLSSVLVDPRQIGLCVPVDAIYETGLDCLRIDVHPQIGYWFNVAAVALYCICGFDGSPTVRFVHRRLFPDDQNPPPNCYSCFCRASDDEALGAQLHSPEHQDPT